jgi:hypothetical protein
MATGSSRRLGMTGRWQVPSKIYARDRDQLLDITNAHFRCKQEAAQKDASPEQGAQLAIRSGLVHFKTSL